MHLTLPTILWLDAQSDGAVSSFRNKLSVHEMLRTFTDVAPCISYIKSHPDEMIILVTSGTLAVHIVEHIYDLHNP